MSLLLPSPGHLVDLLLTLAVALLCVGLGQFVGARRPAIAMVAGWGAACLVFVLAGGVLGVSLAYIAVGLGMVGLAGLALTAQGSFDEGCWAATGRILVLAVPFLLAAAATAPSSSADYAQWLPNLDFIYRHDHFPSLKVPALGSERPGQPYAVAFVGYVVSLASGRLAETAGSVWNALLLVAVGALCADMVGAQIRGRRSEDLRVTELDATEQWGVAGIGLLAATMLDPFFVPRLFFSYGTDGAIGSVTGVAVGAIAIWLAAETRKSREERLLLVTAVGFCCAVLTHLRLDGLTLFALVFVASVAATPLERQVGRHVSPGMLLLMLPPALLLALLWRGYQAVQMPDQALAFLPPGEWHWAELPAMALSMLKQALARPGATAVMVLLLGFALAIADAPELFTPFQRAGVVMGAVLGLGKLATVVVTYVVGDYTAEEAAAAKDFWPLIVQVGPALVAAAIPLVPPRLWALQPAGRLLCIAAPLLALALPVMAVRYLRADLPQAGPVPYLLSVGREVAGLIGAAPHIVLIDPDDAAGELSALVVVRYELQSGGNRRPRLQPGPPVPAVSFVAGSPLVHLLADGSQPRDPVRGQVAAVREADMRSVLSAPYLWLRDGGPAASALVGTTLAPGASYLLARQGGAVQVVRSWPFAAGK